MNIKETSCPSCKKTLPWSMDNPFRPFCSSRCKIIDLGAWASEQHRISGEPQKKPSADQDNNIE